MKRQLYASEIEDIISCIQPTSFKVLNDEDEQSEFKMDLYSSVYNARENLRKQLVNVYIYPELIDKFKQEIQRQYYKSILQPGEMVGVIAASSIGERQTQSSLNSFHSSGSFKANLTGGLARLQELMNATENTKTPSLTIYFNSSVPNKLEVIRQLAFSKIIWVELDDVVKDFELFQPGKFDFQAPENWWYPMYKKLVSDDYERANWCLRLRLDSFKLWRHQITIPHIVKQIHKHCDVENKFYFAYFHESLGVLDVWVNGNVASFADVLNLKESGRMANLITEESKVNFYIHKVILPSLLQVYLSGVEGVKDCYYTEIKNEWRLDTKGGKLKKLLVVDCVDGLRCRSNNMHEIYELFGIEAVKQFLRDEFGMWIKVDQRHLELLIDSMTVFGTIQRVTRNGIDRKQVGTIAKASFEQPVDNFLISATTGEIDPIKGVSASITVGKLAEIGTGFMELYIDNNKIQTELKKMDEQAQTELMKEFDEMEVEDELVIEEREDEMVDI